MGQADLLPESREVSPKGGADTRVVLQADGVSVRYKRGDSTLQAVSNVSLRLERGEVLGIVGESGSGKSTFARTILRLLPRDAKIDGRLLLGDLDLSGLSEREFNRRVRWSQVSMVFQDAMNALNPVIRIKDQISEVIIRHGSVGKREAEERAADLIVVVGLDENVLNRYPHQLSGGMRQRVCIAMAFACDPVLLLADEPTTALDVITQDRVIAEMLRVCRERHASMIFISHDIALVSEVADRIGVMYAGHLVELGDAITVLREPSHPYTIGLLNAFPRADIDKEVISIPGDPARFKETPSLCPFSARCPFAEDICRSEAPPVAEIAPGHAAACHFPDRAASFRTRGADPDVWSAVEGAAV